MWNHVHTKWPLFIKCLQISLTIFNIMSNLIYIVKHSGKSHQILDFWKWVVLIPGKSYCFMHSTSSSNKYDNTHSFLHATYVFYGMHSLPDAAVTLNVRCNGTKTDATSPPWRVCSDSKSQWKCPNFGTVSTKKDALGLFDITKTFTDTRFCPSRKAICHTQGMNLE